MSSCTVFVFLSLIEYAFVNVMMGDISEVERKDKTSQLRSIINTNNEEAVINQHNSRGANVQYSMGMAAEGTGGQNANHHYHHHHHHPQHLQHHHHRHDHMTTLKVLVRCVRLDTITIDMCPSYLLHFDWIFEKKNSCHVCLVW